MPLPDLPPLFRTQVCSKVTWVSWWILLKIRLSGSHVWNNLYKHAGIHWISLQFNVHHHFPIGDVPILSSFSISRSLPGCSQLSITKHLLRVAQQPHRGVGVAADTGGRWTKGGEARRGTSSNMVGWKARDLRHWMLTLMDAWNGLWLACGSFVGFLWKFPQRISGSSVVSKQQK